MMKPKLSKFFQRPATKTGCWAGILALAGILMLAVNNLGLIPLGETPTRLSSILIQAYNLGMFACLAGAVVLGMIALLGRGERSWMVWLFIVPVVFLVVGVGFMAIERIKFSQPGISSSTAAAGTKQAALTADNWEETGAAPTPAVTGGQLAVIFDDDGSPDGTSALVYLLAEPGARLLAVSTSYGEAHPQVYIHYLGELLQGFGYGHVPLAAGADAPLAGDNSFPPFVRDLADGFWGFGGVGLDKKYPVADSAALMRQTILSSEEPVTLLLSGALTNLAQALRDEPRIAENIKAVYIMGGALYVPGNLNDLVEEENNLAAEWNIYVDPLAAHEVFNSGLDLYLVPLDATNSVNLTRTDTAAWRQGGMIADFAADIYDSLMGSWGQSQIEMWDLVTAEVMLHPEHCAFSPLRLEVVTAEGNFEGQTRVVAGEPNVMVCLAADGEAIRAALAQVFGSAK